MHVTLVQDSEHQIYRRQGRCYEKRLAAERLLVSFRGSGEEGLYRRRKHDLVRRCIDGVHGVSEGDALLEVERDGHGGKKNPGGGGPRGHLRGRAWGGAERNPPS